MDKPGCFSDMHFSLNYMPHLVLLVKGNAVIFMDLFIFSSDVYVLIISEYEVSQQSKPRVSDFGTNVSL